MGGGEEDFDAFAGFDAQGGCIGGLDGIGACQFGPHGDRQCGGRFGSSGPEEGEVEVMGAGIVNGRIEGPDAGDPKFSGPVVSGVVGGATGPGGHDGDALYSP